MEYVCLYGGIALLLFGLIGMLLSYLKKRKFAVLAKAEIVDIHIP